MLSACSIRIGRIIIGAAASWRATDDEGKRSVPLATLKMRMGATHFLMKTLPKVATEMALHVLAYNLTRVMNIVGIKPFLAAIRV